MLTILAVPDVPIITTRDQFFAQLRRCGDLMEDNDILVVAHTPWSRVADLIYDLETITPTPRALELAEELEKDPRHIETILRESNEIVKYGNKVLITENKAGIVCANAGIDQSNAGLGMVVAVPHNPDAVARELRQYISTTCNKQVAIIISDTVGRALRTAAVNIAIGVAGIAPLRSEIGKSDLFGYTMRVSVVAIADEIAGAAELLQGQTDEGIPFVIVRGYQYQIEEEHDGAKSLNRPKEKRLFQ